MLKSPAALTTSLLRQFVPSQRFLRTNDIIIDRSYLLHPRLDESSIKVLNWNIAKNNYDVHWTRDFLWITNRYKPDIICLQEVRMCTIGKHIENITEMNWSFAPNFVDRHHNTYSGVLTAAKSRLLTQESLISQHSEPLTKTPKISLITKYPLFNQSQTLLTINTHLINFVDLNKFNSQLQELEARISLHNGPIIFSGDFNTWSYSRWFLLKEMTAKLGLTPALFPPQDTKKVKRFLLSPPLDYIFYRGLNQKSVRAKVIDNIYSSDHKPMLVEFSTDDA
ncbi:MAG: endonuclease/exonuclease/phosphatase family protein [Nostocaceae cyanobacterium]|nr:endonuclease/exonuclease/phosphatase family protein [Nostocaceae cyanobacterium]